jgi:lipoprotein signal peptidase
VQRWQGIFIALNGFLFSFIVLVLPCAILHYRLWVALLIGGAAGSLADILWAFGMLFQKRVTIYSAKERKS